MNKTELIDDSRIRQIVSLIDLTNLNDNCDRDAIETLCSQTKTPVAYVAAVCIWPTFVFDAKKFLGQNSPVKIATVVNFPTGNEPPKTTCALIDKALNEGADEIDYVLPYTELINGNVNRVVSEVKAVRNHVPGSVILKVILETGVLDSSDLIRSAANIAIDQGADFIKTSTGKVAVNATQTAATIMLNAIAHSQRDVGFKPSGGIKTINDANVYLKLAEERFGYHWADSTHFRFGASGLLQDALDKLALGTSPSTGSDSDY